MGKMARLTELAVNVRRARRMVGMSQRELAQRSGVSRTTIATIESGQHTDVKLATVRRLAAAMSISVGQLTSGTRLSRQQACVERFIKSHWTAAKPVSQQEISWLRGLPEIPWIGGEPTDETFFWILEGFRRRKG